MVLLAGLTLAQGCSDHGSSTLTGTDGAPYRVTRQDSIQRGDFSRAALVSRSLSATPRSNDIIAGGTVTSLTPGSFLGASQPSTIHGTVDGSVRSITIVGNGAILCSGNYGELVVYDRSGAELQRVPLALIDEADCSPASQPDNLTYGAHASVTTTEIIGSFDITPMSPLEFEVSGVAGGRASQTYTITTGVSDAPDCVLFADPNRTDPLFADPKVQAMLVALADDSKWNLPLHDQVERGAYLVRKNGVVSLSRWEEIPKYPPNPCMSQHTSSYFNRFAAQGFEVLAKIHTHPKALPSEPDPGNCMYIGDDGNLKRLKPDDGTLELQQEPSLADMGPWSRTPPPPFPGYVLSAKTLYKITKVGQFVDVLEMPINKCVGHQNPT